MSHVLVDNFVKYCNTVSHHDQDKGSCEKPPWEAYKSTLFQSQWSSTALMFFQQRMNLWNRKLFLYPDLQTLTPELCICSHKVERKLMMGQKKGRQYVYLKMEWKIPCWFVPCFRYTSNVPNEEPNMQTFYYLCVKKSIYMVSLFYPLVRIRAILKYASFGTDSNFRPSHCQTDQQMEAKTSMWGAHQPKFSVFKLSADLNLVKKKLNGLILCKTFF